MRTLEDALAFMDRAPRRSLKDAHNRWEWQRAADFYRAGDPAKLAELLRSGDLVVKRQEVVSGSAESRHGCDASYALMRAMPVVVMCPALEHRGTLG